MKQNKTDREQINELVEAQRAKEGESLTKAFPREESFDEHGLEIPQENWATVQNQLNDLEKKQYAHVLGDK